MTIKRLKEIPLLKDFKDDEIELISSMLTERLYKKGTIVWERGSPEQGLQIIDYGSVRVTRKTKEGDRQILAVLKDSNFFGELSLLDGRTHSATLEALEDTKVFILQRIDIDKLLEEKPRAAYKILSEITIATSEKLRDMSDKFMRMVNYVWE